MVVGTRQYTKLILLITIAIVVSGCPKRLDPKVDELNCQRPDDIIVGSAVQVRAFTEILPGFFQGGLDVKSNPAIIDTIGKAARGNLADEYIICRANKLGIASQKSEIEYLRKKLAFARTSPTADQYLGWESSNPPPAAEIAVNPIVLHFFGNPFAHVTINNFGDSNLQYWVENFPEFPLGPFFLVESQKQGKISASQTAIMDIVISARRGLILKDEYTFIIRSNIRRGERSLVTIKVNKDIYQ